MIEIQIILKDSEIYANESNAILYVTEVSYGLAVIDLIAKEDQELFNKLEDDFKRFIETKNRDLREGELSDSMRRFVNIRERSEEEISYNRDRLLDRFNNLQLREKQQIEVLYDDKIKTRLSPLSFFINTSYLDEYKEESDYIRSKFSNDQLEYFTRLLAENNELTYRGLVEAQKILERVFYSDVMSDLKRKRFKIDDFREWLLSKNSNKISQIKYSSSANSLEYIISTLIIFGFDNYDLAKDVIKLTYDYVKVFYDNKNFSNESQEVIASSKAIEISPSILRTAEKYNEVDIDYDLKNGRVIIKLKR